MDERKYANRSQRFVRRKTSIVKGGANTGAKAFLQAAQYCNIVVYRAFWQELDTYSGEDPLNVWIRSDL